VPKALEEAMREAYAHRVAIPVALATGKELWSTKLETGSYTVPMTFLGKNGKQYVVLTDTGGTFYDPTSSDAVIAFALP